MATSALTKPEREIILSIADDERSWHVRTESLRAVGTRLRKVAAAWGVTSHREGHAYVFDLPLAAVRFAGPGRKRSLTDEQRARLRASFQNRNLARQRRSGTGAEDPGGSQGPQGPEGAP